MSSEWRNQILAGDAVDQLRRLPAGSVDTMVTSVPFFGQRDYGVSGQIGLEESVEDWVRQLTGVMSEVKRVLAPHGSAWIDVADTYSRHPRQGAPAKGMLLGPQRLLLALVADGWLCRNVAVWSKPNPMPSSVGDRLTNAYDSVFHLVTQARYYYYDLDAIREEHTSGVAKSGVRSSKRRPDWAGPHHGANDGLGRTRLPGVPGHLLGKNPTDVWTIPVAHSRTGHHATFPERLVERPILATCPERVCTGCGKPWGRSGGKTFLIGKRAPAAPGERLVRRYPSSWRVLRQRGELTAACDCGAAWRAGVVLDPFCGTATTCVVARRLGRDFVGIELSPRYAELARQRLGRDGPPEARAA